MKRSRQIIAILLLVVTIVSIVSVPAYASTDDNDFYNFTLTTTRRYLNPQQKDNASPCYVYVHTAQSNTTLYVAAHGSNSAMQSGITTNCTLDANGATAVKVTILPKKQYIIRSLVNERGFPYAALGFSVPAAYPNTISGQWSPDSSTWAQNNCMTAT